MGPRGSDEVNSWRIGKSNPLRSGCVICVNWGGTRGVMRRVGLVIKAVWSFCCWGRVRGGQNLPFYPALSDAVKVRF